MRAMAGFALGRAKAAGADDAEFYASETRSLEASTRLGEPESIGSDDRIHARVTVYGGDKSGSASVTDLSEGAVAAAVDRALESAKHSNDDPFNRIVEERYLPKKIEDLGNFKPADLSSEALLAKAARIERLALAKDPRLQNSEGAEAGFELVRECIANTLGFEDVAQTSYHYAGCYLVAAQGDEMEVDGWSDVACDFRDLDSDEDIADRAAQAALGKLGARPLAKGEYPVVFDARVSGGIFRAFFRAVSGGAVYNKSTFLLGKKGSRVFPAWMNIMERPHVKGSWDSSYYDDDLVATRDFPIVENGVLSDYLLGLYMARKLGAEPNGHGGGVTNVEFSPTHPDRDALLADMGTGLLVTETMGGSVNLASGSFSKGVGGFWVENGRVAHPVSNLTVGGDLGQMLMGARGMADDPLRHRTLACGSLWLGPMAVGAAQ